MGRYQKRGFPWLRLVQWALGLAALGFLAAGIWSSWRTVSIGEWFGNGYGTASVLLFSMSTLASGAIWYNSLHLLSEKGQISFARALHIHSVAWLYRYVPGKVVGAGYKVWATRKFRFTATENLTAFFWETTLAAVASMMIALPVMLVFTGLNNNSLLGIGVVVMGSMFVWLVAKYQKRVLLWATTLIQRQTGKALGDINNFPLLHWRYAVRTLFFHFPPRLLTGTACAVLVLDGDFANIGIAAFSGAVFLFATVIGLLSPISPAGLGVREGVMVALLSPFLGVGSVVALALVTRILSGISDFLSLGVTWAAGARAN